MASPSQTEIDRRSAQISRYCFGLVGLTWGLMVFGASVRVNGAGLACPDWPLCFGEVIPTIDFGVFFEFGHRVVAGGVSLSYLAIGSALFLTHRSKRLKGIWAIGLTVLGLQVVLGGLTVWELLAEWTVTSHLLAGNTFCLMVLILGLSLRADAHPPAFDGVSWAQRLLGVLTAVVLALQLSLGGLVSSSHAGLVCPTWPSCAGSSWFPSFSGLLGLQVSHRILAYTLSVVVLVLLSSTANNRTLRAPAVLLMIWVQIGLR